MMAEAMIPWIGWCVSGAYSVWLDGEAVPNVAERDVCPWCACAWVIVMSPNQPTLSAHVAFRIGTSRTPLE